MVKDPFVSEFIDFSESMFPVKFDGNYYSLDIGVAQHTGRLFHDDYRSAAPFPHIVIDNFLPNGVL